MAGKTNRKAIMTYLIIAESGLKRKIEVIGDNLIIGTDPGNHVVLKDPAVSGKHCRIFKSGQGFEIMDLGSKNGTRVNGRQIEHHRLEEADVIQVGGAKLALRGFGEVIGKPDSGDELSSAGLESGMSAMVEGRRRRKRGTVDLAIRDEYDVASKQNGDRIVRRRLRQGSGMPTWAMAAIAVLVIALAVVVVIVVMKQAKPSPHEAAYIMAKNLETAGDYEAAIAAFKKIPRDDAHYGELAEMDWKRLENRRAARERQKAFKYAKSYYENNILLFIHKYLDAPAEKPSLARKIRLEYQDDRKSYIRILVRNRIDHYLELYSDQEDAQAVRDLRKKYTKEWDENTPPVFRDVELEAEAFLRLNKYGAAYQVMKQWEEDHPGSPDQENIDTMKRMIWNTLQNEWGKRIEWIRQKEREGKYRAANDEYDRFLKRCKDYDIPEVREMSAEWKRRFDENEAKLHAQPRSL
jgi:pSer/pThr/pTyr-binding forkhead associated (FHA) protein